MLAQEGRIHDLEVAVDAAYFQMETRAGIESNLGDEVRRDCRLGQITGAAYVSGGVELGRCQTRISGGQGDGGSARGTAHILVGLLDGETESNFAVRMVQNAHARLPGPCETRHVV